MVAVKQILYFHTGKQYIYIGRCIYVLYIYVHQHLYYVFMYAIILLTSRDSMRFTNNAITNPIHKLIECPPPPNFKSMIYIFSCVQKEALSDLRARFSITWENFMTLI